MTTTQTKKERIAELTGKLFRYTFPDESSDGLTVKDMSRRIKAYKRLVFRGTHWMTLVSMSSSEMLTRA